MTQTLRILIVGGYGTFGGRLAKLLSDEPQLCLLIAGRSASAAQQFCAQNAGRANMIACHFDRMGDLHAQLQQLKPDIVVDAAGPFQAYGADPYALVRAALDHGAHYLDLADASQFVAGIRSFDTQAHSKKLFVLSGVSSFPVLTAAVVRALLQPGDEPLRVESGILPSPLARIGPNVMRAITSYAGRNVALTREGHTKQALALVETRRMDVATPGRRPLGRKRFTLVDVPELTMFQEVWPTLQDVWVGVAMSPAWLQRCLNALARAVHVAIMPSLTVFAPLMLRVHAILARGEHRGGMVVRVSGTNKTSGKFARSWHMTAEGDAGPMIPSMPAALIIKRCLAGHFPPPGARAALQEIELAGYDGVFRIYDIAYGFRDHAQDGVAGPQQPLYRRVLAGAFNALPPALHRMHDRPATASGVATAAGRASIERGRNPLARLVAWLFGFPAAGTDVPVSVAFSCQNGSEIWERNFAGHCFSSVQSEGMGRDAGLIVERFGPLAFGLSCALEDGVSHLAVENWRAFGIPMPLWAAAKTQAREYEENGRFHFDVRMSHPLTGLIVHYRGWLAPTC